MDLGEPTKGKKPFEEIKKLSPEYLESLGPFASIVEAIINDDLKTTKTIDPNSPYVLYFSEDFEKLKEYTISFR